MVGAPATVCYGALTLLPSPLWPPVAASQRLFLWRGVNAPPASTLPHHILARLAGEASSVHGG